MVTPILMCVYRWGDIHTPNYYECQFAPITLNEKEIGEITECILFENGRILRDEHREPIKGFDFIPYHNFMSEWDKKEPNLRYYTAKTEDEAVMKFVFDPNPVENADRGIQEYIREWMKERIEGNATETE